MTAPRKGEHGEPWKLDDFQMAEHSECDDRVVDVDDLAHAIACVNLLDGVDPALLGRLRAAVEAMIELEAQMPDSGPRDHALLLAIESIESIAREMGGGMSEQDSFPINITAERCYMLLTRKDAEIAKLRSALAAYRAVGPVEEVKELVDSTLDCHLHKGSGMRVYAATEAMCRARLKAREGAK